jgi:hypothetical protein
MNDNVSYNRYALARKRFRSLVKKYKNQSSVVEHYINVEKLKKTKPKSYWKQIKLTKSTTTKLFTINGKTTHEDISSEFKNHFQRILNTPRISNTDNELSNTKLKELLDKLENDPKPQFYITEGEVKNAIDRLKKNKSRDPFQLKAEHFALAIKQENFLAYLTDTINKLFISKELPQSLSTSLIIPLVKSHKKSLKDPNNYRGISLIPIITKTLELIIIDKCPQLKDHKPSQFGFVSGSSTIHSEILIQDTVNYYNDKDTPVYICSLDAEKAFDSCNWLKLLEKIASKKDIPSVLKLLIKLYLNGEASINYKNNISDSFELTQGVRQGSILSPYLYNIYTEELLDHIMLLQLGTYLPSGVETSIIAFADDLILISPNLIGLQTMLDSCVEYGLEHCIKFNQSKTQFTISGNSHIANPH